MIKLYHAPISPNSRRVWITLLEKGVEFELVEIKIDGEQFKPEFSAISPFHKVPALVDDDFKLVESLAILDYLEAKYPTPTMLPKDALDLATVRMVELVTVNELLPATSPLIPLWLGLPRGDSAQIETAKQKVSTVLRLFESLLDNRPYFGSQNITLAEPVAGTVVPLLPAVGISLNDYPKINAWTERLLGRAAWQTTQPTPDAIQAFKSIIEARIAQQAY